MTRGFSLYLDALRFGAALERVRGAGVASTMENELHLQRGESVHKRKMHFASQPKLRLE